MYHISGNFGGKYFGRKYFGGLLKMCNLAEFALAVEPVLAIMIFITKWIIERAGGLTRP